MGLGFRVLGSGIGQRMRKAKVCGFWRGYRVVSVFEAVCAALSG